MKIPFTTEDFFRVFSEYNNAVFPVQILFYILSGFIIFLLLKNRPNTSLITFIILGLFWIWMGVVYHIVFFSKINPAAYIFGGLFVLQGVLFIFAGILNKKMVFKISKDISGYAGWMIMFYGLVIYPVLGFITGHSYPYSPELSAPCPTTIFTFGILLFVPGIKWWLLVIPLIWSLLGFSAALNLDVIQDFGLLAAGLATLLIILLRRNKQVII